MEGRPIHWEDGAPFVVVSVLDGTRRNVWKHAAGAYQPRVLRLDNTGPVPIAIWVECADDRTTRTTEVRLGVGGGDELRVHGAVYVDAASLDANAGSFSIACVDANTQGGDPNTEVRITLPLGAPGAWTDIGYLPRGRRWASFLGDVSSQPINVRLVTSTGTVVGGFSIPVNGPPPTVIHPPGLLAQARTQGAANLPLVVSYAAR